MSACFEPELPQRVDNGTTVEPMADVQANYRLRQMNSAADGHKKTTVHFLQS